MLSLTLLGSVWIRGFQIFEIILRISNLYRFQILHLDALSFQRFQLCGFELTHFCVREMRGKRISRGGRREEREEEGEVLDVKLRWVGKWRDVSNNTYFGVI